MVVRALVVVVVVVVVVNGWVALLDYVDENGKRARFTMGNWIDWQRCVCVCLRMR